MATIEQGRREGKLVTGLLYVDPKATPFSDELQMIEAPLAQLPLERARPPKSVLDQVMEQLRTGKGLEAPAGGG